MIVVSSCSCLWPIHWSQVLSWEWRCSWSSSSYIWVINNFIANSGVPYIRGLMVIFELSNFSISSYDHALHLNSYAYAYAHIYLWNEAIWSQYVFIWFCIASALVCICTYRSLYWNNFSIFLYDYALHQLMYAHAYTHFGMILVSWLWKWMCVSSSCLVIWNHFSVPLHNLY